MVVRAVTFIAFASLILSLGTTFTTLWNGDRKYQDALELTKALLSWQVVAGAIVMGVTVAFREEISGLLKRFAEKGDS